MPVTLHLTSGQNFRVENSTIEDILEMFHKHGDTGYAGFTMRHEETGHEFEEIIMLKHIVKISGR